uniref:2b n=1 Tax=Bamboo rat arterivirus TaxID=3038165 RepID=A0AAT9TWA9_9NIDO|nr:2b [Bamboo rat arterivirus]WFD49973.1 2b [Bamboo rat arterivirus]WFG83237.1 GP2 [Arteriviridae sp.]WFG95397.1 GP2 [Arteriviridae sp.]
MHSLPLLSQSLTLLFILPYFLLCLQPVGCWYSYSGLFSPRATVRPVQLSSLTYRKYFRQAAQLCKPDIIPFGKGYGMLWHMKVATLFDDVIHSRIMSELGHQGQDTWARIFSQSTLENLGRTQVIHHFQKLAELEREACVFLTSRLPALQSAASIYNVTVQVTNDTYQVHFNPPINNSTVALFEHLWLVSMQASIFSSVGAAFALWIVILLRLPNVFGFLSTIIIRRR